MWILGGCLVPLGMPVKTQGTSPDSLCQRTLLHHGGQSATVNKITSAMKEEKVGACVLKSPFPHLLLDLEDPQCIGEHCLHYLGNVSPM